MHGTSDSQPAHCAHLGRYGSVRFAQVQDGSYPAEEFWSELSTDEKAKFMSQFRAITDSPSLQLRNRRQFKQVDGDLFEFKRNDLQMRVFAFRHRERWYLLSGLIGKKEDDLPPGEVKRALALMSQAKARIAAIKGTV